MAVRSAGIVHPWLTALRTHSRHACLGAAVIGLLVGPRAPLAIAGALLLCPPVAGRPSRALLLAAALLGGAVLGDARLAALDRTALGPDLGHATTARGWLLEPPRPEAGGGRAAIIRWNGERILVRAPKGVPWPAPAVGDELAVEGVLRPLGPRDGWLRPRNVHAVLRAARVERGARSRGGPAGVVDGVRRRAEAALARGLPPSEAALLRGMVLGQDDALPRGMRDDFRTAGLAHLVAASGQNVMLLCGLVFGLSALVGIGFRTRLLLAVALIGLYVPLAGGGASIQRAGVMGAAGIVAALAGRPASRWYALLLAAAATLAINPRSAAEPGWQLSFAAVAGIMVLARPVAERLRRSGVPAGPAEAFAVTAAATLATAPLIALHFGRTSVVTLPANVMAVPAVAPVMWLGMAASVVGQVSAPAAAPFAALAAYPAAFIAWVGHTAARVPLASVAVDPAIVGVVSVACAAAVLSRAARRPALVSLAVAAVVALAILRAPPPALGTPTGLRVTFLDIGQGDATLIQHRDRSMLIDTGPADGGIVAGLRRAGVRRLDVLMVTHAQADHDGGAAAVLRALPVGMVLDGRDGVAEPFGARMLAEARRRRVPVTAPDAGQTLRAGGIGLRILSPEAEAPEAHLGSDPNERAIVAEARVGRFRMLLTADAESDVLSRLDLEPVDILKVSHHGSADPGLGALLERLRPGIAGIEVGAHNGYGHPDPSTLATLRTAGVAVYRTDRDGTVRLEERAGELAVATHG